MSSAQNSHRSLLRAAALKSGGAAARRPVLTLVFIGLITAALTPFAADVQYDDDVLEFLPQGTPEIKHFKEIGQRFHGLSVAVIGVEATQHDLFTYEHLTLLRRITLALRKIKGVTATTSFTEQQDISVEGDTTIVRDLVAKLPDKGPATTFVTRTRKRVLSRDHIRGFLVSPRGDATLILANIDPNVPMKAVAEKIRSTVARLAAAHQHGLAFHFGGAPFIGSYVARVAREDITRLSPWVAIAVILIVLVTARSFLGAIIALASVGVTIVWIIGLLTVLHRPLTLVSSSLPMLLMALGSAYSVHLLTRILGRIDAGRDRYDAVMDALADVGPPIIVAGLTTAVGFVSFLVMDIEPMREFGGLMAIGTVGVVFLGIMTVSAASVLMPLKARQSKRMPAWAQKCMLEGARRTSRHPVLAIILSLSAVGLAVYSLDQRPADINMEVFFEPQSEPVRAENFLEEKLGGALFVQVEIQGDIKHPVVLRQIQRLSDLAITLAGVTGVQSVVVPMVLGAHGLAGQKRIPASVESNAAIALLLADADPAMRMLVDEDWEHALVQIKVSARDTKAVIALIDRLRKDGQGFITDQIMVPRSKLSTAQATEELDTVVGQLRYVSKTLRDSTKSNAELKAILSSNVGSSQTGRQAIIAMLKRDIVHDEMVYLAKDAQFDAFAANVAKQYGLDTFNAEQLYLALLPVASAEEKQNPASLRKAAHNLYDGIQKTVAKVRRVTIVDALLGANAEAASKSRVSRVVSVLSDPYATLPQNSLHQPKYKVIPMSMQVSGYPVVYDTMNRSVYRNQTRSLGVAAILVLITLSLFFRSLVLALIALVPAMLTLAIVFSVMGLSGMPMDVGTSMVASIALGVGIDYSVHLTWSHQQISAVDPWPTIFQTTGWGIVINALEVTAGFAILMLGTLVPMRHVGMLVAVAMVVGAVTTLTLVPAMLDRYQTRSMRRAK